MVKIEILKLKGTLLIFTQIQSFIDLNPIIQALIVTSFTWFVTAMEASLVFLLKDIKRKILDGMVGFTAGIMLAVIFWSLLFPSFELPKQHMIPRLPVAIGFD